MPGQQLVDAELEIIIRDQYLEDAGEVRNFTNFNATLKLSDVSSWQLDMHTEDYNALNAGGRSFSLGDGIMFNRDHEQIVAGPVMKIVTHYLAGDRTTTIYGGDDNFWLSTRVCYPVVEGLIFDNGIYRFGKMRSANGLTTTIAQDVVIGQPNMIVTDASGFLPGATFTVADFGGVTGGTGKIAAIDYPQNTIINTTNFARAHKTGALITQSNTTAMIDDPTYLGYDIRSGPAESVMKELVYFNASTGACVDSWGSRAVPHLIVAPSVGLGNSIVSNARGETLLTQIQNIAIVGQLFFNVTQDGTDLVFDTFKGRDLTVDTELVFSVEAFNLKEYQYGFGLPTANMIIGVGPNAGVDKIMMPSGDPISIAEYGRFESWGNASQGGAGDKDSPEVISAAMLAANNVSLLTSAYSQALALSLQETDQIRFPRDFNVGDKVRIMVGDVPVDQVVTTLNYSVPAGGASGMGSSIAAFSPYQQSQIQNRQKQQGELLKQLLLNTS